VSLRTGVLAVLTLFPLSEIALVAFRRADRGAAEVQDAGSFRVLWVVISAGVVAAVAVQSAGVLRLPIGAETRSALAIALILAGMAIRWAAILTLGRMFTVDVAIHQGHRLVETGLYRFVRHPSYTGLIVAFLGVGVYFGNGLSIAAILVPTTIGVWNRIRKEEGALLRTFGPSYTAYAERTKRLIPGLV
jgi:protein-S-isoprenylcysteine O-methyltransferase Ste14